MSDEPENEQAPSPQPEKPRRGRPPKKKVAEKKTESIPPCPPTSRYFGSKTPEVVAWYRVFKPEEAEKRYKNRTVDEVRVAEIMAQYEANR